MPRRIILHTGFHKTGTTTIASTLRTNRQILNRRVALRLPAQMQELISATRGYSTWRDPLTLIKAETRFYNLLDALPSMPQRSLILSSEELGGHLPGRGDIFDYSAMPILLHRFWTIARERFPDADIAIYLSTRNPDAWLTSAYWQHVKSSSMTLDLDAFSTKFQGAADLQHVIDTIRDRLPCPVHHCSLEDSSHLPLGPTDPLLDLCHLPRQMRDTLVAAPVQNIRPDSQTLLALLDLNRTVKDPETRVAMKKSLLAKATMT